MTASIGSGHSRNVGSTSPRQSALWCGDSAVREFLMRIDVLPWDSAAATRYGVLRAALEFSGAPLGNLDTLIAAHALAADAILVTHDHAFARVPALVVENWVLQ